MDPFLARTMVESLSKGINPISGRVLPVNDSCSNEEMQEALLEVLEHCSIESNEQYLVRIREENKAKCEEKRKSNAKRYPRGGEAWTAEEERKLLYLHRNGCNIYQIANTLKRTPGAISDRLKKVVLMNVIPLLWLSISEVEQSVDILLLIITQILPAPAIKLNCRVFDFLSHNGGSTRYRFIFISINTFFASSQFPLSFPQQTPPAQPPSHKPLGSAATS